MAEYSVAPPNFLPPTLPILFLEDAIQYDPMKAGHYSEVFSLSSKHMQTFNSTQIIYLF